MTTTPDADVRAALDAAAGLPDLRLDPALVLDRGHRVVRRRRVLGGVAGAAAAAIVAVVAVQLGTGQTRPLPPAHDPSRSSTAVRSGSLHGTTFSDGIKQGAGFEVAVEPGAKGQVTETWTLSEGNTTLKTVRRTRPVTADGQASFLMPDASGQKGVVYGYVLTGDQGVQSGVALTQLVSAPDAFTGDGAGGNLSDPASGRIVGSLFIQRVEKADPTHVIGLIWGRSKVAGTQVTWLGDGAALRPDRTGGVDAAVVTVNPRLSVLLWRNGDRFGFGHRSGPSALTDPGTLQVGVEPRGRAASGMAPDLAVGWVTSGAVELTSTDPGDSFTVVYGTPVGGRTPFVAVSANPDVKGAVTVRGGGESQTLTTWDAQTS
ncbi:hypothetical protein [Intrasporangium flavum]|uniref:hypothetical protein n=1 Tax=Intrasporangium flavum TaxID=1428657 RepID=UPI00096C4B54|nr:hypothetical protein [Intrasporangium flavum]